MEIPNDQLEKAVAEVMKTGNPLTIETIAGVVRKTLNNHELNLNGEIRIRALMGSMEDREYIVPAGIGGYGVPLFRLNDKGRLHYFGTRSEKAKKVFAAFLKEHWWELFKYVVSFAAAGGFFAITNWVLNRF